jgi:hypothetical protein
VFRKVDTFWTYHPLLRVAPQLKKKDLAKFCRGRNYGISAPPPGNSGLWGRIFGLGENINMKTVLTFASGICFR